MFALHPLRSGLAFLGRHATRTYAASIFLGLALPWLAEAFRPFLPVTIVTFIMLSFARADLGGIRRGISRPGRLALVILWSTLAMPVLIAALLVLVGRESLDPGLLLGLSLIAAAPPLMASPVYATILGFEASGALITLVIGMVMTPFISPPLASFIAGTAIPIDPVVLSLRLAGLLGLATLLAVLLRRFAGLDRLARYKPEIDGIGVVCFFVFAIAAMDGVIALTMADPWRTALYLAVSFAVCTAGFLATLFVMAWIGRGEAFVLALGVGLRNTGLLVAPMGAAIPDTAFLFFSLLQFPIYMAPLIVEPLAKLVVGRARHDVAPPPPQ